jgi:penicillin amidase
MGTIQGDSVPVRAQDIGFLLADAAPATEDGGTVARDRGLTGDCNVDSVGCAAYMTWEYHVMRAIFDDDLGDLARDYVGSPFSWVMLYRLLEDPSSIWWDDRTTADVETADGVVLRALDLAGADLRTAYGDPADWTWGRLHTATFEEATIGASSGIGPLEWYFNKGPFAVAEPPARPTRSTTASAMRIPTRRTGPCPSASTSSSP